MLSSTSLIIDAIIHANEEVVEDILKHGLDPNSKSGSGNSLLKIAVLVFQERITVKLLQAGARFSPFNEDGYWLIDRTKKTEIGDVLNRWPGVIPLQVLCLRAVHYSFNKPTVPDWFPPLLLEWPEIHEYLRPEDEALALNLEYEEMRRIEREISPPFFYNVAAYPLYNGMIGAHDLEVTNRFSDDYPAVNDAFERYANIRREFVEEAWENLQELSTHRDEDAVWNVRFPTLPIAGNFTHQWSLAPLDSPKQPLPLPNHRDLRKVAHHAKQEHRKREKRAQNYSKKAQRRFNQPDKAGKSQRRERVRTRSRKANRKNQK